MTEIRPDTDDTNDTDNTVKEIEREAKERENIELAQDIGAALILLLIVLIAVMI